MAGRLEGKIAIITGTGGSMGQAAALLFAQEGASIVGCDYRPEWAEETLSKVRARGGRMVSLNSCDLTNPALCEELVALAMKEFGRIDILYNNAAMATFASIPDMTPETFRKAIVEELDLVFFLCRAAWPRLIEAGGGSIINTASKAAIRGNPNLGYTAHAAAKGAVVALTRQLAVDGGPYKIRANSLSPGTIRTKQAEAYLKDVKWHAAATSRMLLKRLGEPEDVANCALFLASDESKWVTGIDLLVDGGACAW